MSLHGDIRISGHKIGSWDAKRTQRIAADFNDYYCTVYWKDVDGKHHEAQWTLYGHAYVNGAVSLAARVLNEAIGKLQETNNAN